MTRTLMAAVILAVASSACSGNVQAFGPSPVSAESAKVSGSCGITLTTLVKGFPYHTVAEAEVTGCDPADTVWSLTSNPDGVVYRVYVDRDKLLADQPSANGRGAFLRVFDFIAANPVCVQASVPSSSASIGMLGATCR
jgi:hypothetical protein